MILACLITLLGVLGAGAGPDGVGGPLAVDREGTASGSEAHPPQETASLRPLELHIRDRWIGNAVCYGPHRDGQRPGGASPSAEELAEDLRLMAPHWSLLRIYGASGFAEMLLRLIRERELEMKVMLGVWIDAEDTLANRREIDTAIRLTHDFPDVVSTVCVGNETQVFWSAHQAPVETLIAAIRRVRAAVSVPVTTADDFNYWNKPESRRVAAELDYICLHAHPMWNGILLEDALPWMEAQLDSIQALHPDRFLVIGETGWATSVHDEGEQAELIKGRPGEREQKEFYDAVRAWAETARRPTFVFEAFDENWKGGPHPDEVEKHWGLFRADRMPKAAMQSPEHE